MKNLTAFFVLIGLAAPAAHASTAVEATLGPVVAVERSFTVDVESCLENFNGTGSTYTCEVNLYPKNAAETCVDADSIGVKTRLCVVGLMTTARGYYFTVMPQPSQYGRELTRAEAVSCLKSAFEQKKLGDEIFKSVVFTVK